MTALFFVAPWCTACKGVKPNVHSACTEAKIPLTVVDISTPEGEKIAEGRNIYQLPTLILDNGTSELDRIVGTAGKYEISRVIAEAKKSE